MLLSHRLLGCRRTLVRATRSSSGASSPLVEPSYGLWIDNEMVEASGGDIVVENPATEQHVTTVGAASVEDVARAVASCSAAASEWRDSGVKRRAAVLRRAAEGMRRELPRLTQLETLCTGRPIAEFRAQLARLPEWFEYHASLSETFENTMPPFGGDSSHFAMVERRPLGVVGLITPWNHPLLIATKKIAVALATGNVAVVKPAEIAPVTTLALARILMEAGAPPGVLNVVPGHGSVAGAAIARHADVARVDFTGGDSAGAKIGAIVGARAASYCAELGGNAPVLVFDDADVEEAVNGVAFAAFVASGQTCVSAKRIMVHADIFDDFLDRLVAKTKGLRIGDPSDPLTQIGPLSSAAALERVATQVEGLRAVVLAGGAKWGQQGHFYEPTVLTGCTLTEEVFGPVVAVTAFRTEEEALHLANETKHGLGAGLWTRDLKRAHRVMRKLRAGVIWCNAHHRNAPDAPWGGYGASGTGRENGVEAYREYTTTTTMIVKTDESKEDWFAHKISTDGDKRYG